MPHRGAREHHYDPRYAGLLVTFEDLLAQAEEMGIEYGYDVSRVLKPGNFMEKTLGRRLPSEAMIKGRTEKEEHTEYARPGFKGKKKKLAKNRSR